MGNINFSEADENEARKTLKHLVELFKTKNVHPDHLVIYNFMIFYGTMFLNKEEAINIIHEMQDIFEPNKTLN